MPLPQEVLKAFNKTVGYRKRSLRIKKEGIIMSILVLWVKNLLIVLIPAVLDSINEYDEGLQEFLELWEKWKSQQERVR